MMTTGAYLASLYGNRIPGREEQTLWKLSEIEMFHKSPLFAISNYFRIPNKDKTMVPLRPFAGQAILDLCIEAQYREGLPQRVAGYKSRQVGWSTWMLARALHRTCSSHNRRAMFLVPDEDVAAIMAGRMGAMLNGLPVFLQAMRRIQNQKHIVFDNPNPKDRIDNPGLNSELQITVPSPLRGIPPDLAVFSEYSHMKEAEQFAIQSSIIPGMGLSPYTCAVIDTTPNGDDDFYKPLIENAVEANPKWIRTLENAPRSYTAEEILAGAIGKPDVHAYRWMVAFERWDWHEEYAIRCARFPRGQILRKPPKKYWEAFLADIGKNKKYGGEEERDLQGRYGVQIEQLYWRRQKVDDIEMPTAEMQLATFHQEFAMSIAGGFVELDKTPFDRESLDALGRMRKDPIASGLFARNDKDIIGIKQSLGTQWHQWRIYAPPDPNEKYAMGVDTAEAYESADSDMSAVAIMRHSDRKLVAIYVGKVPPHIMLEQVFLAYQFFLRPYMGVETRGSGYYLIRQLIDMGVSNYYSWKRLDKDMPEPTAFPGWQTDSRTRPQMDAAFIKHLCWRHPDSNAPMPLFNIPDAQAIKQIQGIRRGDSGSLKHQHGKDDIFDAICICLMLFDDPYGSFHAVDHKAEEEKKKKREREEFEGLFSKAMPQNRTRNRPSLASL